VEEDCEQKRVQGGFAYLMARGALLSMQSRCAFLQEVAGALHVRIGPGRQPTASPAPCTESR
jgi:hypothetical protein